jgi:hypothetical protein
MMFAYKNVQYEDKRVTLEEWKTYKSSKLFIYFLYSYLFVNLETPFGAMPLLYIDDFCLCQSGAIFRYIGREFGASFCTNFCNFLSFSCSDLYGKTPIEMATADMIEGCTVDGFGPLGPWWCAPAEDKVNSKKK